jgi:hypothetical protein
MPHPHEKGGTAGNSGASAARGLFAPMPLAVHNAGVLGDGVVPNADTMAAATGTSWLLTNPTVSC